MYILYYSHYYTSDMKIGFFDSGLGGLTIMKAVSLTLPQYDYIFFGDTANLPLGDKTEEEIYQYTKAGVEDLFKRDCLLVILACNTASSETLRRLQDTFLKEEYPERRILGVVIPTVEELINSGSQEALLIATRRTVESNKYPRELGERTAKPPKLTSLATPELVPLIEHGELDKALEKAIEAVEARINTTDTLILGCTHYNKLKEGLRQHFSAKEGRSSLRILAQDEIIPAKLTDYLDRHPELTSRLSTGQKRIIVLTQHRSDYDHAVAELLEGKLV